MAKRVVRRRLPPEHRRLRVRGETRTAGPFREGTRRRGTGTNRLRARGLGWRARPYSGPGPVLQRDSRWSEHRARCSVNPSA